MANTVGLGRPRFGSVIAVGLLAAGLAGLSSPAGADNGNGNGDGAINGEIHGNNATSCCAT